MKNLPTTLIRRVSCVLLVFSFFSVSLNAQTVKRDRDVPAFKGIKVGGAFNVTIEQSDKQVLSFEADEDVHEMIEAKVSNGILRISMDWPDSKWDDHNEINVIIKVKNLESLSVSGAADVSSENVVRTDRLDLDVSGAGDLDLKLDTRVLEAEVSGAGDVNIEGETIEQMVVLNGAADYNADDFNSKQTTIKTTGAGTASVNVSEEIEATASGASSIRYSGDPEKVAVKSSGAGSVKKR